MGDFVGVVPAIATPMGQDGRFNEEVFRKIVEFNIEAGVHGFWVAGGTGESVLLDDDENMQVASADCGSIEGACKSYYACGCANNRSRSAIGRARSPCGCRCAVLCAAVFFIGAMTTILPSIIELWRVRLICRFLCTICREQQAWKLRRG